MNTPAKIVLAIYFINLLVPIIVGLACLLVEFWSRGRTYLQWFASLQNFKCRNRSFDNADALFYTLIFDGLVGGVIASVVLILCLEFGYGPLFILAGIAALFFIPRLAADVTYSLRYNFREKESERIAALESEIQAIKNNNA